MSLVPRQHGEQQRSFLRQATILRKNVSACEGALRSTHRGEVDWPSMLGRLNAAFNQAGNLDQGIEDASEHFVYVPRKCTANAQDMAFFLSTRLVTAAGGGGGDDDDTDKESGKDGGAGGGLDGVMNDYNDKYDGGEEPMTRLRLYEGKAAELAAEFEDGMVRF